MSLMVRCSSSLYLLLTFILLMHSRGILGTTFTLSNNCHYVVWPGILSGAGSPTIGSTGFELKPGGSRSFQAQPGWSGRFWGRTGCIFDHPNIGNGTSSSCSTGDCGSGQVDCNGAGAAPPATLAEFTIGSGTLLDFYDVSLVDGYNLPMMIKATGGSGDCAWTGCETDLNSQCPPELRSESGGGCRSACEAFKRPDYCCNGAFGSPNTCQPSVYSRMFKNACPRAYSYAYDDRTSTFTCSGADYTITFCPAASSSSSPSSSSSSNSSSPSSLCKKSPQDMPPVTRAGGTSSAQNSSSLGAIACSAAAPDTTPIVYTAIFFFLLSYHHQLGL